MARRTDWGQKFEESLYNMDESTPAYTEPYSNTRYKTRIEELEHEIDKMKQDHKKDIEEKREEMKLIVKEWKDREKKKWTEEKMLLMDRITVLEGKLKNMESQMQLTVAGSAEAESQLAAAMSKFWTEQKNVFLELSNKSTSRDNTKLLRTSNNRETMSLERRITDGVNTSLDTMHPQGKVTAVKNTMHSAMDANRPLPSSKIAKPKSDSKYVENERNSNGNVAMGYQLPSPNRSSIEKQSDKSGDKGANAGIKSEATAGIKHVSREREMKPERPTGKSTWVQQQAQQYSNQHSPVNTVQRRDTSTNPKLKPGVKPRPKSIALPAQYTLETMEKSLSELTVKERMQLWQNKQ